ncbi:MAG: YidC/Oxa1 family membrane protein insertase [Acholeplasmatales bacterium]|jgi:YidC/Oxa1 family membrane protein insertase|nr:YidC/Oxa1 family membrane protein insertase [Acholeplasmatales bacterium]
MIKKNFKYIVLFVILVCGFLVLTSCSKTVEPSSIIVRPKEVTSLVKDSSSTLSTNDIDVYYLYNNAQAPAIVNDYKLTSELLHGNVWILNVTSSNSKLTTSIKYLKIDGGYTDTSKGDATPVIFNGLLNKNKYTQVRGVEFDFEGLSAEDLNFYIIYSNGFIEGYTKDDKGHLSVPSMPYNKQTMSVNKDISKNSNPSDPLKTILRGGSSTYVYSLHELESDNNQNVSLSVYNAGGEEPIYFGHGSPWFDTILIAPFAFLMSVFSLGDIFALGIILLTIIVRTIAWPVYANSNNMSFKMSLAQPDIQKLELKYQNRKDPQAAQAKQAEMMQLYKKHGIKMTGCLLMLVQLPIFSAMWQVVRRIGVAGGQFSAGVKNHFLFGIDLNIGNSQWSFGHIFLVAIMAITYIALMLIGQRKPRYIKKTQAHHKTQQTQKSGTPNPMANMGKTMIVVMSIMMIYMSFTNNNALGFYWIIGNIYSIAQNLLMKFLNDRKYHKIKAEEVLGKGSTKEQYKAFTLSKEIEEIDNEIYDLKETIANAKIKKGLFGWFKIFTSNVGIYWDGLLRKIKTKRLQKISGGVVNG